jgi:exosome complex exonuclease DIS3/RRP44
MAGRASVEFYVGLALKARGERLEKEKGRFVEEEGFVIRVFRNGVGVFVSKSVLSPRSSSFVLILCLIVM